MAQAIKSFRITKLDPQCSPYKSCQLSQCSKSRISNVWLQTDERRRRMSKRASSLLVRVNALPDWPLMAVFVHKVQQLDAQREFTTIKSIWHLSDATIKNVYTFYIMFTCWGCLFFGSTKDPYYDSEEYRKEGGDGSGNWKYEKQDEIEANARAELWREELIEEIEQKVGGLRELEEAGRK